MRYLITGAQGFVGRHLSDVILNNRADAEVLGLGRSPRWDDHLTHSITVRGTTVAARTPGYLRPLPDDRYRYEQIDLLNTRAVREVAVRFRPDAVIHLASGLRGDDWRKLVDTNVSCTASLLAAIGDASVRPSAVVLGSTGGVYGVIAPEQLPVTEDAHCEPSETYSATKLCGEQIGRIQCADLGIRCVVARLFNIVGAGQSERHVCGRFASALAGMADQSDPVLQAGDLTTTRDYIDVRDAASALLLLAESGEGVYNIGSGVETTTEAVLSTLSRIAGARGKLRVLQGAPVAAGVRRHAGSIRRLQSLGYVPAYILDQSLQDLFNYYIGYQLPAPDDA